MAGMEILPGKDDLIPIVVRSVVLALVAYFATGRAEDTMVVANTELHAQEAKAGLEPAKAETNVAYEEYYELIRYHAAWDASCDQALEMFARHRDDDHDWEHVLEACHSETPVHVHDPPPVEDPSQ